MKALTVILMYDYVYMKKSNIEVSSLYFNSKWILEVIVELFSIKSIHLFQVTCIPKNYKVSSFTENYKGSSYR